MLHAGQVPDQALDAEPAQRGPRPLRGAQALEDQAEACHRAPVGLDGAYRRWPFDTYRRQRRHQTARPSLTIGEGSQ
jgi:hypothetical protein